MLVRIKGSRLFAGSLKKVLVWSRTNARPNQGLKIVCWFFKKIIVRSRTNACSDQGLKIVCWFFKKSSCSVKNQCLSESRAQDCLLVFFQKFLLGQKPMLVRIKGSRLFVGFFSEVLARSKTNACPDQGLKIVCWFFFGSSRSVKNQCLSRSRAQDYLLVFFRSSFSLTKSI
jgi:hypothetical protein